MAALNGQRQLGVNTNYKAKTAEKLASGYKINRASDDAAGLSISEKMRKQVRGLTRGVENTQAGVSLCQVADGALAEVHDMLQRMSELSVQAVNGTNSHLDRQAIQEEINQLLIEIDRIGETTSFNDKKIFLDKEKKEVSEIKGVQIGEWYVNLPIQEQTITYTRLSNRFSHTVNGVSYNYGDTITATGLTLKEEGFLNNQNVAAHWMMFDGLLNDIPKEDGPNYDISEAFDRLGDTVDYNDLRLADLKVDDDGYVYFESTAGMFVGRKIYLATTTNPYNNADWNGATLLTNQVSKNPGANDCEYVVAKKIPDGANVGYINEKVPSQTIWIQSGCEAGDGISLEIDKMSTYVLGINKIDVIKENGADKAMTAIGKAITILSSSRSKIGAQQNRLEHTIDNGNNIVENTTAAESRIRDADMAELMIANAKNNIIAQATQSMLAQSNQSTEGVLNLLK